jgi:mRNA interferase HigB
MIVTGRLIVERYFEANRTRADVRAAIRQFDAWLAEANGSLWRTPVDIKRKYRNASILKSGRVVFNISGNKYRLIVRVNYAAWVVDIRFFGTHAEYDRIDAESV